MDTSDKELERRRKISEHTKGRTAWNKGLTNCLTEEGRKRKAELCKLQWLGKPKSEEHKRNISEALKGNENLLGHPANKTSFKKGLIPWNKGMVYSAVSKENNPNWKGGISSEYDKARCYRFLFKDWTKQVFERDLNKCRHCGGTDRLRAHHVKGFVQFSELRYDVSNGITLCISCHTKEHARIRKISS